MKVANVQSRPVRVFSAIGQLLLACSLLSGCKASPQIAVGGSSPDKEATETSSPAESPRCPAEDFNGFLRVFANDKSVRDRYTASQVEVTHADSDDETVPPRSVMVNRADYDGFWIAFADGQFRPAGGGSKVSPGDQPLTVAITAEPEGTYLVGIPDNVEGAWYRFRPVQGCWNLTEQPGTPSP